MPSATVYGLFRDAVAEHGAEPAIVEDGRALTFGELSAMVDAIAGSFPQGTASVGIVMRHRAEMIAAILAVLKVGARYVPAEPDFPQGRIQHMMAEAEVDFVITESDVAARLEGLPVRSIDDALRGSGEPRELADEASDPDAPAYVLYTSGTTGAPKGVCVANRNVCHYVRAFANEFRPGSGDVMLQHSVCSFDIFVEEVFGSLLNGAALAIPAEETRADLPALMDFIDRHRVTIVSGFPYLLADMNELPAIPPSIRLLISGGDVLRASYVDRLLSQATLYNTYGPSETTVCATYYRCNDGEVLPDGTYPIGRPVLGARIRVLDDAGGDAAPGEVGEICILGGGVSLGYIGDHPDESLAFQRLPDGETMYRSGDFGYLLPDGNLAFLHRRDGQIMILGRRVEVGEVEFRILQCKGVRQAFVHAAKDDGGLPYMVAYVVPDDLIDEAGMRRELALHLADFMIPEFFVQVPRIPLNENGKPDIARLPAVAKAVSR